jgi:hypothetical protein
MAFNINGFQGALAGGGARPNLFQVMVHNPTNLSLTLQSAFMIQASSIPESTLGVATQNYFGRPIKFAGNRTVADWTVTVINDEDFAIRSAMEDWSEKINGLQTNLRDPGFLSAGQYKSTATVTQYGKGGETLRSYSFRGIFPVSVGAIALDWGTNDAMETFDVTFSVDYWEAIAA